MWDVIVAGAGPAGAVAAFALSRKGHSVLLADKISPSTCKIGEALPGAAERLLRSLDLPTPMPQARTGPLPEHCRLGVRRDFIPISPGLAGASTACASMQTCATRLSGSAPSTARPRARSQTARTAGKSGSTTPARSARDGSWTPPAAAPPRAPTWRQAPAGCSADCALWHWPCTFGFPPQSHRGGGSA